MTTPPTIGVFPATGALGRSTYQHLLKKVPSTQVTLVCRHPEKVPRIHIQNGVRVRQASYEDSPADLAKALGGIDILFLISYPSHVRDYRVKVQLPAVDAALEAGVKHIFYSSLGFALPDRHESLAEVMQAHLATEAHLRELSASNPHFSFTSVREGLYSESFPIYTAFWTLGNPRDEILIPHDGSGPGITWVKRDELGEGTAALIAQYAESQPEEMHGKTYVLTGEREWSLAETVRVLGGAVGRDVKIRKVSLEEWAEQPQVIGYFKDPVKARTWATAWEAIAAGETAYVSVSLASLIGRAPEPYEKTIAEMAK